MSDTDVPAVERPPVVYSSLLRLAGLTVGLFGLFTFLANGASGMMVAGSILIAADFIGTCISRRPR
jgi:hypothetical protein